jgi:L-alanine-DL-glutamate epimerase-like enolase superfamily enzyme
MNLKITSFQLYRLEVPTGRPIGDWTCVYDALDVFALCLKTDQGLHGWGFGETVSKGYFTRPAPYIISMPLLADLRATFEQSVWPLLKGQNPYQLKENWPVLPHSFMGQAVRIALWDLMAKGVELPLYQFLGGAAENNRVRAYGSALDFPLSEGEALAIFRKFVERGFTAVKVKVGRADAKRDLHRLQVVRETVGENVEIAIDANEAWTCEEALQRIRLFQEEGVRLAYVEDPLPRTDMEGLARLNASIDLDVVGHDYLVDPEDVRNFVTHKALSRVRVLGDIDFALSCDSIARDFHVPLICGNSVFELSVHSAVALTSVERLEFSDLAWNMLPASPVRIECGYAIAPPGPGLGLDPDPEMLERFSCPNVGSALS